jgi:hypothetical protein
MASDATTDHDFDGFWKELLDEFLPEFLSFFAPDLLELIDLSQPIVSLEKELHELFPEDRSGRGFVDKLFKVGLRDGGSARLLLHIDAQGDPEASFPERMFRYRYRLIDKYHLPIYSIAVLTDRDPSWRPDHFELRFHDDLVLFRFRTIKLLDFADRIAELERSENPVALLLLAHLRTQATRPDRRRLEWKKVLLRLVIERGFPRQRMIRMLRLVDWLMTLPPDLKLEFRNAVKEIAEEKTMPILMDIEIEAMAKGEAKGALAAKRHDIRQFLRARFGDLPNRIDLALDSCVEVSVLDRLVVAAALAKDLADFERQLATPSG